MAIRRKFAPSSPEATSKKTINIKDFKGLDTYSSMLNLADNHCTSMENMILRNGVLQKRIGWKQLYTGSYINGIWQFKAADGETYTIMHYSSAIYSLTLGDDGIYTTTLISNDASITNAKSFAVVGDDKLYILCGDYFVLRRKQTDNVWGWEFEKVYNHTNTYIPTTTIGIQPANCGLESTRTAYDDVNMLSDFRKNTCNTSVGASFSGSSYKFILDSACDYTTESGVISIASANLTIAINYLNGSNVLTTLNLKAKYGTKLNIPQTYLIARNDNAAISDISTVYGVATIENGVLVVTLFEGSTYVNPVDDEDNMTITFKKTSTTHSRVENCTFGILYGYNGAKNRLFISGNSTYPNVDYHSSERTYSREEASVTNTKEDYTYFSDLDYCAYGSTRSSVKGYQILNNGNLLVMKENVPNETSLYVRTAEFTAAVAYDGTAVVDLDGNALYEEVYPVTSGNIDKGLVSRNAFVSYESTPLFLSKEGVCSITLSDNVASSEIYAVNRSKLINPTLLKETLSEGQMIVYKGKCYLGFSNGNVYVADTNGMSSNSVDGDTQYEWYIYKNIKVKGWYIINDKLMFSNADGIYQFKDTDSYTDDTCLEMNNSQITPDYTDGDETEILVSYSGNITNGNIADGKIYRNETDLYALIFGTDDIAITTMLGTKIFTWNYGTDTISYNGETVSLNEHIYKRIYDGMEVYIDSISPPSTYDFLIGKKLILSLYDEPYKFVLKYGETFTNSGTTYTKGDSVDLAITDCRISYKIPKGTDLTISGCDSTESTFYLIDRLNEYITFIQYNNSASTFSGWVWTYTPVSCHYFTKAYDFGTMVNNKYLHLISIANDSSEPSELDFGYKTFSGGEKWYTKVYNSYVDNEWLYIDGEFQMGNNTFESVTYNNSTFTNAYTKQIYGKMFNYVMFIFKNETSSNCVISNLNITYSYGMLNKGVT